MHIPQFCPVCNESETLNYSGPLWIGELHQENFLKQILLLNKEKNYSNEKIIDKKITYALDEIRMPPFYYDIHKLCQELKLSSVPKLNNIIESIKRKGFNASRTHFDYLAIKCNLNLSELKKNLLSLTKKN